MIKTEDRIIQRHARVKAALSKYQKQLKEPIYRKVSIEREDGTTGPALWEVTGRGKKIGECTIGWQQKDGNWVTGTCVTILVDELVYAEAGSDTEWFDEVKIHDLYFDGEGRLDHVMIVDLTCIRDNHRLRYTNQARGLAASLVEKMGVVTTSLPS